MSWSAAQYSKFEDERNRPIRDLIGRISTSPVRRALDAGCGPGNSSELLLARFPDATLTGMDNSPNMVNAARQRLPGVRFELGDIANWNVSDEFDVILANAVIQWVPHHETLLTNLIAKLAPGGSLAVQFPDNLNEPAHCLMREVAAGGPWAAKLSDATRARAEIHSADWYYRTLRDCGVRVDIWRTTYFHPLAGGASAVVEWFKGTGLRPFLDPLDEEERASFLAEYQRRVANAYPSLKDGTILLPFPRMFFVAVR